MLLAERPEAVNGKYPFLGAVVQGNQILNYSNTGGKQKIASFSCVPTFKSTQMTCPFRKCCFSPWGTLTNPEICMRLFTPLPIWHRWLERAKVSLSDPV